jgi:hypothetical protein
MTTTGGPRRLGLELRFDAQPIQGRLYDHDDGGLDRRFSGWLGLMAAIDAAREGAVPGALRSNAATSREEQGQ